MIRAELELRRNGRFYARILGTSITNTGHEISEDSGFFYVRSILNDKPLSHRATREQAEKDIAAEWMIFAGKHKPETSREINERRDSQAFQNTAAEWRLRHELAEKALRPKLKPGDTLRATKAECGAKEANFIFSHWDYNWIMSTGGASIAPGSVYSINGEVFRI